MFLRVGYENESSEVIFLKYLKTKQQSILEIILIIKTLLKTTLRCADIITKEMIEKNIEGIIVKKD